MIPSWITIMAAFAFFTFAMSSLGHQSAKKTAR
jgi:hypothetical protein